MSTPIVHFTLNNMYEKKLTEMLTHYYENKDMSKEMCIQELAKAMTKKSYRANFIQNYWIFKKQQ